jgi:hypothetical protein
MFGRKTEPILDRDYEWVRHLIRQYNLETDPIKRQRLREKMEEAKRYIDRRKMVRDCG